MISRVLAYRFNIRFINAEAISHLAVAAEYLAVQSFRLRQRLIVQKVLNLPGSGHASGTIPSAYRSIALIEIASFFDAFQSQLAHTLSKVHVLCFIIGAIINVNYISMPYSTISWTEYL